MAELVAAEAEAEAAAAERVSLEMERDKLMVGGDLYPKLYPPPLLSHIEVSMNPVAFYDTLRRFHSDMHTRFMIPVIGGKELNLHQLYVEVTQRGGLEKVIVERRWRDVISTFNFPSTTTSASFVLRKYYLSLLHHYEQVYFFRAEGPIVAPSGILRTKTPISKLDTGSIDLNVRKKRPFSPRPIKDDSGASGSGSAKKVARVAVPTIDEIRVEKSPVSVQIAPYVEKSAPIDVNWIAGSSNSNNTLTVKANTATVNGNQNSPTGPLPTSPTVGDSTLSDVNEIAGSSNSNALTLTDKENSVTVNRNQNSPTGPLPASPTIVDSTLSCVKEISGSSVLSAPTVEENSATVNGNQNSIPPAALPTSPTSGDSVLTGLPNLEVSGQVDGKFEHGYFVTVRVGSQILHGVLYHAPSHTSPSSTPNQLKNQSSGVSASSSVAPVGAIVPYIPPTRSISRRRKHKYRDPDHPKTNRSAYNFFFAEMHAKLKTQNTHNEREYSKLIGEAWSKLTDEERKVYKDYGQRDKDRYKREMEEYEERQRHARPRGVLKVKGLTILESSEVARQNRL